MEILSTANLIIAVIAGIFGVIGGITGAITFLSSAVAKKVEFAKIEVIAMLKSKVDLQAKVDELCQQDRTNLEDSLQTVLGKTILLETELRSPSDGVYVRLRAVETALSYLDKNKK